MLKTIIKNLAYAIAARFGRHQNKPQEPQLLILMYHRILPLNSQQALLEEPGMVVSPETFQLHLEILSDYFEFISLHDWCSKKMNEQPLPAKACVITFDDGWQDNYRYAFPILCQFKIPASIFLVSDMIGTKAKFWPERLSQLVTNVAKIRHLLAISDELTWLYLLDSKLATTEFNFNQESISNIIQNAKVHTDSELHQLIDTTEHFIAAQSINLQYNSSVSLLSWQQVNKMQNSGLIEFGSHTCTHTRLNEKLDPASLSDEICLSQKVIESKLLQPVRIFCYPNGDYSPQAVKLVKQTYDLAVTTQSGWNSISSDLHTLKRISIHEDISNTRTKLLAQLSGWFN